MHVCWPIIHGPKCGGGGDWGAVEAEGIGGFNRVTQI
jgi:hypothetical protein